MDARRVVRHSCEVTVNGEQEEEVLSDFRKQTEEALKACWRASKEIRDAEAASRVATDDYYREGKARIEEDLRNETEQAVRQAQATLQTALQALQTALQALQATSTSQPAQKAP
jgi:hypothetical protein